MINHRTGCAPVFALIVCFATSIFAQAHPPGPDGKHTPHKPTIGDYEEALKHHTHWSENIANPNFYETLEFEMKPNDPNDPKGKSKKVKFTELKPFEQSLFYLYQAENLSNRLIQIENMWKVEFTKLQNGNEKVEEGPPAALTEERLKESATKKVVEAYIGKIHKLRVSHAVQFEKLMTNVFVKFEKEIPEADRKNYSTKVRSWHDKQKLIERKAVDAKKPKDDVVPEPPVKKGKE